MNSGPSKNFALIGAAGFVAPSHLRAIYETGSDLAAAVDPHDCVGILDSYFPRARFFTEIERFDRFLEKQRRQSPASRVEYISICSPNYLHDAHVRMALRVRAHAICEKPLAINPWNLDALSDLEKEFGCRVYTVLQLRYHPAVVALKEELSRQSPERPYDVELTYVTRRGPWYDVSWKGSPERSGGVAMNIGIHFFDLLLWLFGPARHVEVHLAMPRKMAGLLELERARVRWFLSVDEADLPASSRRQGKSAYRSIRIDGREIEMSEPITNLHTKVYQRVLAGEGLRIEDARPSIDLVYAIRNQPVVAPRRAAHPLLAS
jgi:UDP-N-acetyl-2-amino-2-deoxyglucuronate dehydrogenase